jgi:enolase
LFQNNDGSQKISGDSLKNVYKSFVSEYPIVSIEDPFDQDDWVHYAKMTDEMGEQVQIVGDDLLVTNPTVSALFYFAWRKETSFIAYFQLFILSSYHFQRVSKAIKEKSCNALLLKVFTTFRIFCQIPIFLLLP